MSEEKPDPHSSTELLRLRVDYMFSALKKLSLIDTSNHGSDARQTLSEALIEIQLIGTDRQIKMVHSVINRVSESGMLSYGELLADVRNEIRILLGLSASDTEVIRLVHREVKVS